MAEAKVHATRNFAQTFPITFEFPVYPGEDALIKITGMTGHPEYVDPEEWFNAMKKLLKEGKAEIKANKG